MMNTEAWLPALAFLLSFIGIWLVVTFLLSYISGWAFLAEHYRATLPYSGRFERIRSSQMGPLGPFGGARNALYVAVDQQGLHLRMFFLFRLNCPELFMPWSEITVNRGRSFFMEFVEFRFRLAPKIGVRIHGKAGQVIESLAGPAWPAAVPRDVVQR